MKKLSTKTLKRIRNSIILIGMVVSFLLWLAMPAVFHNSKLFHVGNGTYGHKVGALLDVALPLLTFVATFFSKLNKPEFHAEGDEEYQKAELERIQREELFIEIGTATFLSLIAIAIMLVSLGLK
ncbi:MAG: hypothetical protein IKO03_14300 [Lachnospiraceae bacterium]|nr:hypothetical protein [Lachnospiraceae bacterium]MBR4606891.1 hypothetical protein [Lachnospiraceae bacterium]